ncbi:MAG: hypothetical protein JXR96_28490 [Deltaproteobacteria bacterium]|nr:hypothetical protein [Deltaproteobacteria bacterium]
MKRTIVISILTSFLLPTLWAPDAGARKRKTKTPPAPLNKAVKYEAYPNTDVAQVVYETSRKEFRVGHAPYEEVRFHVAEYVLIAEHVRKYKRPDLKAEIKMAPGHTKPALMANKVFQDRWRTLLTEYEKIRTKVSKLSRPKECEEAQAAFLQALDDEIFLASKVAERMFPAQDIRARERLREELSGRFRARNTDWFDRLCEEFESSADLSKFYPRFSDVLIQPAFEKAHKLAEASMKKVGLEYATAVEEDGDIVAP